MIKRELIDVAELQRLSYLCPKCRTEVIFNMSASPSRLREHCPFCDCSLDLDNEQVGKSGGMPITNLDQALAHYRKFYNYVRKNAVGLRLVREVDSKCSDEAGVTPTSQNADTG